jgi:hypothetical protein
MIVSFALLCVALCSKRGRWTPFKLQSEWCCDMLAVVYSLYLQVTAAQSTMRTATTTISLLSRAEPAPPSSAWEGCLLRCFGLQFVYLLCSNVSSEPRRLGGGSNRSTVNGKSDVLAQNSRFQYSNSRPHTVQGSPGSTLEVDMPFDA